MWSSVRALRSMNQLLLDDFLKWNQDVFGFLFISIFLFCFLFMQTLKLNYSWYFYYYNFLTFVLKSLAELWSTLVNFCFKYV